MQTEQPTWFGGRLRVKFFRVAVALFAFGVSRGWVILGIIAATLWSLEPRLHGAGMKASQTKVRNVRGTATYKTEVAGKWLKLKSGTKLSQGAIIQTDKAARVDLWLVDVSSVVQLQESTQLVLEKLDYIKTEDEIIVNVELNLKAGTIRGNVKRLAAASRYVVKIPNGVCAITGTEFKISANGVLYVMTGKVRMTFTSPQGKTFVRDLLTGMCFFPPAPGEPEPKVIPLPPEEPPCPPPCPYLLPWEPPPMPVDLFWLFGDRLSFQLDPSIPMHTDGVPLTRPQ